MYESNSVEFMGILVDRQYAPGQKYVQLAFETAEGIRLSLSRNIEMVRSLRLGLTYRVKGTEQAVGQKRFVSEPVATLVSPHTSPSFVKRHKILIPAVLGAAIITSCAGVWAYAASTHANTQPITEQHAPASLSTAKTTAVTPSSAPTQSQPASTPPSSSTTQSSTKPTMTSTKKTTRVSTPTSPSNSAVATTPVATTPATTDQSTVSTPTDTTTTTPPADQSSGTTSTPTQTPADQSQSGTVPLQ